MLWGGLPFRKGWQARREGGGGGAQLARDGYTRPTLGMPSYGRKRALSTLRRSRRRPSCSPSRDRHIPPSSRRENGGLCPHPPKGPVPWVSLFGERPSSLASGMPSYGRKRALSPLRRSRRRLSCSPSRDRHIPPPSRGENGGLCPHPPKGPVPWESLLGNRPTSPPSSRYPRPPKRRRRQAPARGPAAVCALYSPRPERNAEAPMPPARGAWAFVDLEPKALADRTAGHSRILVTTPEPTVRPPSRMAKRRPSSHAIGVINVISMSMLSPGITISTPSGSLMLPVTSVVRK